MSAAQCVYCERNQNEVPLISLRFKEVELWICPQHMPVLIHDPNQLVGKLPGAENLAPADEHGHHHD